ncbi:uncharacterized protein I303_108561 [Kwoniella dejecticola CBS 10117]|uniref:PXA domain-containing protein n=1 Tax=Kwoniella dejecticola CBS 10117 TaxID=1296121 RepID=A0A1A5ZX24_9TREE|nr:uncharacterized protein I303_07113 [Kwoniella dejecticola CBS 10117]OBR82354.1 hypothetical protein I303_07113 [Kwoniella dejecticola CBS 10117]
MSSSAPSSKPTRPPKNGLSGITSSSNSAAQPPNLTRTKSTVHLPLYRRILFPHDDPSSTIPQIVRGQRGDSPELEVINERLYNLIALALRAYVQSWYIRFSPNRTLSPSINRTIIQPIISPILTDIYLHPDRLCRFLLIDLPTILTLHLKTLDEARSSLEYLPADQEKSNIASASNSNDHVVSGSGNGLGRRYHSRLPLLSISVSSHASTDTVDTPGAGGGIRGEDGEYVVSPLYLKALSSSMINHYIPSTSSQHIEAGQGGRKDAEGITDLEKIMTREILANLVLGSTVKRLVQRWFWYQIILKLLGEPVLKISTRTNSQNAMKEREAAKRGSLDEMVVYWFNTTLQILYTLWNIIINIVALYSASPKEVFPKYQRSWEPTMLFLKEYLGLNRHRNGAKITWSTRLLWGTFELMLGLCGHWLDRLLPHLIFRYILTPQTSLKVIDILEKVLFPDGYPVPSPPDPTEVEVVDLKERTMRRLDEVIPTPMKRVPFAEDGNVNGKEDGVQTRRAGVGSEVELERLLDPIENTSCNAHLVAMLLNCLGATLIPDLVVPSQNDLGGEDDVDDACTEMKEKEKGVRLDE